MSQTPARHCSPAGVLTDRERLWTAMRELRVFTISDLCRAVNIGKDRDATVSESKAKDYLRGLVLAGIVSKAPLVRFEPTRFELINDTGVRAPRVRRDGTILFESGRNRMWKAMRVLGEFSPRELMHAASLPASGISFSEAKGYCYWLARGGYLVQSGNRFRFIRSRFTGSKAPQILRLKQLFDPNTGKVVYSSDPDGRDDQ
jgi:hypothetical protein